MCMNQRPLMGGTRVLGIQPIKLFNLLLRVFSFLLSKQIICLHFVVHALLIAHRQLFRVTSFKNYAPLDIIYIDVWRSTHITGIEYLYYNLLLVDHFTKYIWVYLMVTKSSVSTIFLSKILWKHFFKIKSKAYTLTIGVSSLH